MFPIRKEDLASMNICQILNMIQEFHSDISKKNVRNLMYIVWKMLRYNCNFNPGDVIMLKNVMRLDLLRSMKKGIVYRMQKKLLRFANPTIEKLRKHCEHIKPDFQDVTILTFHKENIIETLYIKICLINEKRLWKGYIEAIPSEIHVLLMVDGGVRIVKKAVHFSPYGHPKGLLKYKTALLCNSFLSHTIRILQMHYLFEKTTDCWMCTSSNRFYARCKDLWDRYFAYLRVLFNFIGKAMDRDITFCPFCEDGHYISRTFFQLLNYQTDYFYKLKEAIRRLLRSRLLCFEE